MTINARNKEAATAVRIQCNDDDDDEFDEEVDDDFNYEDGNDHNDNHDFDDNDDDWITNQLSWAINKGYPVYMYNSFLWYGMWILSWTKKSAFVINASIDDISLHGPF